jgi:PPM family protein phosphatase
MATNSSGPGPFQSMLARLRGMAEAMVSRSDEPEEEVLPSWDTTTPPAVPLAEPVAPSDARPPAPCPHCGAPRKGTQSYCDECGWIFPEGEAVPVATPAAAASGRLLDRYEIGVLISERGGIARFHGMDHAANGSPVPVIIIRAAAPPVAESVREGEAAPETDDVVAAIPEAMADSAATDVLAHPPPWPSLAWEAAILRKARHPALPNVLDTFTDGGFEYLVEEAPAGQLLWDAWDDPEASAEQRFLWLKHVAEALHQLHLAGAILEGLRPDILIVSGSGLARFADLSDLLPLPLPPSPPIRATPYTAPELVVASDTADARADLYSFGAMLYALHVGRELTDVDFDRAGTPKPFIPRFPDIHPLFGRLISKTFCRDAAQRFPTDEAGHDDPTGFQELIRVLDVCRRSFDNVRLDIAAWTTTGMVRTGNEDAFALLHGAESRQDDLHESALVFLCDGMGGYEAGEVAAALAIQTLRKNLLGQKPFAFLSGASSFQGDGTMPASDTPIDPETCKKLLDAALRDANRQVFSASRGSGSRRGMGCTAEAVFVSPRFVAVGHVGDSRTYHLHNGRLLQITRDQTFVNRMVELGQLTAEQAENHPRRSELQQAIGGHADVDPALYHSPLLPGDWVVVCSDGVSNHVSADELKQMLQSEATSAEMAARRLVNFVNLKGATDNATVVVVRAT